MRVPTSSIAAWLEEHLRTLDLSEGCEGYLLGRGATSDLIAELELREWAPAAAPCPSSTFARRYGAHGERLTGWVVTPLRAPTGRLIGIEARSWHEKLIAEFRTPEADWNPVAQGTPQVYERLTEGGSAWVVEGVYDLCALRRVVPPTDGVLSTLRAGLSRSTVDFLARHCRNRVYMVYDNDATGRRATYGWVEETGKRRPGALELLSRAGVKAVDFRYRGKDPGEVWRRGGDVALRQEFGLVSL